MHLTGLKLSLGLALLAGLSLLVGNLVAGGETAQLRQSAQEKLSLLAAQDKFSGTVLVARDNKLIFSQGYGLANQTTKQLNTPQTRFGIGSITKQFTAVAILQLVERGKLRLDDSICNYFDTCPTAWQSVTLLHLLTHTSGIPERATEGEPNASLPVVLEYYVNLKLESNPGETFRYFNGGYALLGYIIERVAGQPYTTYLAQNIFQPLGMSNTGFECSSENCAVGYTTSGTKADSAIPLMLQAAGGIYSTAEDLARWDEALYTDKLVSRVALDKAFSPLAGDAQLGYGYGWYICRLSEHKYVWHCGTLSGYNAGLSRLPDNKTLVIALANSDNTQACTVSTQLAGLALSEQTLAASRPWVAGAALLLALLAGFGLLQVLLAVWRNPRQMIWKRSFWLAGWTPLAGSALLVTLLVLLDTSALQLGVLERGRVVETIVPLLAGLHAAYCFSPEDEAGLEVLLACPRPAGWLLLERLALVLGLHGLIALVGSIAAILLGASGDPLLIMTRWIAPTLLLVGLGTYATQSSRQGLMGIAAVLLGWGGLLVGGDALMGKYPLVWPLHLFLQPQTLAMDGYYVLNRISLTLAGGGLLIVAVFFLKNEERVLLGKKSKESRKAV